MVLCVCVCVCVRGELKTCQHTFQLLTLSFTYRNAAKACPRTTRSRLPLTLTYNIHVTFFTSHTRNLIHISEILLKYFYTPTRIINIDLKDFAEHFIRSIVVSLKIGKTNHKTFHLERTRI